MILIASDAVEVRNEVRASIVDTEIEVREVDTGDAVLPTVRERTPDLVVLDQQIGSMGAMAVRMEMALEEGAGRLPEVPVLILLDRRADVFLAKRATADGWVLKPLDPLRLRRAMRELMAGRTWFDDTYRPVTVPSPAAAPGSAG